MRRTLSSLSVGLLLGTLALGAQAPPLLQVAPMPGQFATPPQSPGGPARDTSAPAPTGTAKIRGRVMSAATGSPLGRAQIRITAGEQRIGRITTTDADGRYEFADLPGGRYLVNVSRNGYVTLQFGQRRPFEPGKPLELAEGQLAERIDFALPPGSVIAGRITDEFGEPVAGVNVSALRYQYQPPDGQRRLSPAGPVGTGPVTDDLGQFRVYGLMPGTYMLAASGNQMSGSGMFTSTVGRSGVTTVGPDNGNGGYATTYYPGTTNESEAQRITLGIGQEATASFSLIATRLLRVSGMVRSSQGSPSAGARISLRIAQAAGGFSNFGTQAAPDGSFTILNVPEGDHTIEVRPTPARVSPVGPAAGSSGEEFASVPISVRGRDQTGLLITTGLGATISGRLVFEGASEKPHPSQVPFRVMFGAIDPSMAGPIGMNFPDNGVVDAAGTFQLKGVNGKGIFRAFANTTTGWIIKSITLDGVEITDTPYEATPSSDVSGLQIVMTDRQTTLSGGVRTRQGEIVKDYVIAIFPASLRDGDVPARFVRAVRPNQEGRYQIRGLPSGDYFAAAVESLEQGEQWDPAFQQQVKPRAKTFKLSEGQALALDLPLLQ